MNSLFTLNQQTLTMSSREIAELCEKRHELVLRDIANLNEAYQKEGYPIILETPYIHPQNGQTYKHCLLTQEQVLDLVTGYKHEIRIKINRRWQELEQKQGKPDLMTALNDPIFLRNTLVEYSEKVIELTPKANAFDRIATKSDGSLNLTESAKHLQVPPKKFNQFLFAHGWIYRRTGGKSWVAYQDKLKSGYLEHKVHTIHQYDGTESLYPQVLITAKGLAKLAQMLEMPQQLLLE
ncbi:TPA: phage antirepressor KilAC domain-containing protein [Mannheimia haemolytica]